MFSVHKVAAPQCGWTANPPGLCPGIVLRVGSCKFKEHRTLNVFRADLFELAHCIHSHSRAQSSIALSSMEAEALAATGLLIEGIAIKQALQFLLRSEVQYVHGQQYSC